MMLTEEANNYTLPAPGANYSDQGLIHLQLYMHHLKVPKFFISLINLIYCLNFRDTSKLDIAPKLQKKRFLFVL